MILIIQRGRSGPDGVHVPNFVMEASDLGHVFVMIQLDVQDQKEILRSVILTNVVVCNIYYILNKH